MFLHIDLDCFFVSAARSLDESLKGKVVAVAGGNKVDIFGDFLESGIIVSASYEARKLGINCTMHSKIAKQIYPSIIILPTDFDLYERLSNSLFEILSNYTNEIEKYSIDEYFVDLAGTKYDKDPLKFAKLLKDKIQTSLDLPCSIGLSKTKFMAKLATNLAKPNGIKEIKDKTEVQDLEISKFPGIGKSTTKKLNSYGVYTIKDAQNSKHIFDSLGKNGVLSFQRICAQDKEKVQKQRQRKSMCLARTFKPLLDRKEIKRRICLLCRHLSFDVFLMGLSPSKFELKFKYTNSLDIACTTSQNAAFSQKLLETSINELFVKNDKFKTCTISYISIGLSGFAKNEPNSLFELDRQKELKLNSVLGQIRSKYGIDVIKNGGEI